MRLFVSFLVAAALLAASCSGDEEESGETGAADAGALTILAASSLQGVFQELAPEADFRFGSSEELAAAIRDGAAVDVFAAASPEYMADLRQNALIDPPVAFAMNRLVLVVPTGNPAGVESIADLADVDFLVGADLGYTTSTLGAIGAAGLSEGIAFDPTAAEQVASGAADAALVYYTDALAAGDAVGVIELQAQALVEYPVAASTTSERYDEAEAFVELLLGEQGRAALEEAGFGVPLEGG